MQENIQPKIVIADDDFSSRVLLKKIFDGKYCIEEAGNGVEAMKLMLSPAKPLLILLDLHMPYLDGYGVMREMHRNPLLRTIPVVVVTASEDADAQREAFRLGAVDVVTKPFNPETILYRVTNIITPIIEAHISEENKWRDEFEKLSEIDEKTGLWNKQTFCRETEKILAENPDKDYILVRWDIDRFKVFNDTYGVSSGDKLLADFGKASLVAAKIASGIIALGHYDADHFVSLWEADGFCEDKIYAYLLSHINHSFPNYNLCVRIGFYRITDHSIDAAIMCDRALMALRTVKNSYDRHYAWYDESMRLHAVEEQKLTATMNEALKNGEFVPYFQPQYNYDTGTLIGAEALVRWIHPDKGLIPPSEFVPAFEKNGFITEIDMFIWEDVCRRLRKWLDAGYSIPSVSVNVSRCDVYRADLVDIFKNLTVKYRIPPKMLHLEITESAYMDNPDQLIHVVNELKQNGFFIEMDDFGSGYSSLNTLKDVPVGMLKLDIKFITESADNTRGGSILSSVVRMAHSINLPVIAEGVETHTQAEYLKSIGCLYMQGYHFARPMPSNDFEKLIKENRPCAAEDKRFTGVDNAADFLNASTQSTLLFNSFVGGAGIIEYENGVIAALRLNDRFFEVIGTTRGYYSDWQYRMLERLVPESRETLKNALDDAASTGKESSCEICSLPLDGSTEHIWTFCRLRYLTDKAGSCIFYFSVENISERKRLSKYNKRLNNELTAMVNSVPGGVQNMVITRENGKLIHFNDNAASMFGYTGDEYRTLHSDGIYNAIHPEDCERVHSLMKKSIDESLDRIITRYRHSCRDGSWRWVQMSCAVIKRESDRAFISMVMIDIDSQVTSENLIQDQQSEINAVVASLPGGVFRYSPDDGAFEFVSDTMLSMLGYTQSEFNKKFNNSFFEMVYCDDRERVLNSIRGNCVAPDNTHRREYRIETKNGSLKWIYDSGRLVTDQEGKRRVIVVAIDLDDRKQLEAQLRYDREEIETLVNSIPSGLSVSKCKYGKIIRTYVSETARKVLGYTGNEQPPADVSHSFCYVHPQDLPALKTALYNAQDTCKPFSIDIRIIRNNKRKWINISSNPVVTEDKTLQLYSVYTDVTARKAADEELHIREEEYRIGAEQSDKAIFRYTIENRCLYTRKKTAERLSIPVMIPNAPDYIIENKIIAESSFDALKRLFDAIDNGEPCGNADIIFTTQSGKSLRVTLGFICIHNSEGKPVSAILSYTNITDNNKSEKEQAFEYTGFFKAMRMVYPMCIIVNLSRNTYHLMDYENLPEKRAAETGNFDDFIELGVSTVPEEDKQKFRDAFSRQNLLDAFSRGEESVRLEHRQIGGDGIYHWTETVVLHIDNPYDDDVLEITVSRVIDEQKDIEINLKETLESTSGELARRLRYGNLVNRVAPGLVVLYYQSTDIPPYLVGNLPQMLGYTNDELIDAMRHRKKDVIHPDDFQSIIQMVEKIQADTPEEYNFEFRLKQKNGNYAWISVCGMRFADDCNNFGYISTYVNCTEQHNLIERLRSSQESYRAVVDNSNQLIFTYTIPDKTAHLSYRIRKILGLPEIVENVPDSVIEGGEITEDTLNTYISFYESIRAGMPCEREWIFKRKSGNNITWLKSRYSLAFDKNGQPVSAIVYMDDITESKHNEENLINLAEHDGLTGLYNRAAAEMYIIEELRNGDAPCVLLIMDLDDFKSINDTLGHDQGDRALRIISDVLKRYFRGNNIVGRLGGDEFIVFMPGIFDEKIIHSQLISLLRKLSTVTVGESDELSVHCSIGAAVGKAGVDDFSELYKKADVALYQIKRSGKNDYAVFEPSMMLEDYFHKQHEAISLRNNTAFDSRELRSLVSSMASLYTLVISADLTKSSLYLMESSNFINSSIPTSSQVDDFIRSVAATFHPDDRADFIKTTTRSALLDAYQTGITNISSYYRQIGDDGIYHWVRVLILFYRKENGNVCAFALVRTAPEKEQEREIMGLHKILELAVISNFECICLLNPKSKTCQTFLKTDNSQHLSYRVGSYNEIFFDYIKERVTPDGRDEFIHNSDIDNILSNMKIQNGRYYFRYKVSEAAFEVSFYWYEPTHTDILMMVRRISEK